MLPRHDLARWLGRIARRYVLTCPGRPDIRDPRLLEWRRYPERMFKYFARVGYHVRFVSVYPYELMPAEQMVWLAGYCEEPTDV